MESNKVASVALRMKKEGLIVGCAPSLQVPAPQPLPSSPDEPQSRQSQGLFQDLPSTPTPPVSVTPSHPFPIRTSIYSSRGTIRDLLPTPPPQSRSGSKEQVLISEHTCALYCVLAGDLEGCP